MLLRAYRIVNDPMDLKALPRQGSLQVKKSAGKPEPLKQLKLMLTEEEHHTVKLAALLARQGVGEYIKDTVLRNAIQETDRHLK